MYVRDARAEELPLVGRGEHDWAYLLGRLGWLPHDQAIGHGIFLVGVLMYLAAIAGALHVLASGTHAMPAGAERANDATVAARR